MLIDWPIALMAPQIARFAGRLATRSRDFGNINLEDSCVSRRAAPDYEFVACAAARSPMTHDFTIGRAELCRHARPDADERRRNHDPIDDKHIAEQAVGKRIGLDVSGGR
jgi:hypothetical protein